jgi:hypothetical protein
MNNISVNVRNLLGPTYGTRTIGVNEDGNPGDPPTHSVSFGSNVWLPLPGDNNLQSIEIVAQNPQDAGFSGNGTPIPIIIDSPQNYVISTLFHEAENRWRIEFETPISPFKSKTTRQGKGATPPVNVTVGHDEPGWSERRFMINANHAALLAGGTGVVTLGLSQFSTILGGIAPLVLVLAGIIFSFKQWKEKKRKLEFKH